MSEASSDGESIFDNGTSGQASSASSASSRSGDGRRRDDACIVGMACRVPGASRPSELWENILSQKDMQRKMPEDRFNVDAFYHPNSSNKGTTNAKYGYFLDQDISMFDASFFNISGKEAEAMDPQHRLLLEVVYEALEDSGIDMYDIAGTTTSVYCGSFTNDYNAMTTKDLEGTCHSRKATMEGGGGLSRSTPCSTSFCPFFLKFRMLISCSIPQVHRDRNGQFYTI